MTSREFFRETVQKQRSYYKPADTCQTTINAGTIQRQTIINWEGTKIACFPLDTPDSLIYNAVKALHGEIGSESLEATFHLITDAPTYSYIGVSGSLGEVILMPGIVKDNIILQVFPDLRNKPTQDAFEAITGVAKILGGEVKSIAFQVVYHVD